MSLRLLLATLCVAALASATWAESLLYSQNTLLKNGHWVVWKRTLMYPPSDAELNLRTRLPVAGNVLHFESFGGHQEFLLKDSPVPAEASFAFRLRDGEYLDFIYNAGPKFFSAARLSARPDTPSMRYRATVPGRYESKTPFATPTIASGWHEADIKTTPGGLFLAVDGKPFAEIPDSFEKGSIGFRSGLAGARLARLEVKTADGQVRTETFRNSQHAWAAYLWSLGITMAVTLALFTLSPGAAWSFARGALALGLIWFTFDFLYWSTLTSVAGIRPVNTDEPIVERLEDERWAAFYHMDSWLHGQDQANPAFPTPLKTRNRTHDGSGFFTYMKEGCTRYPVDLFRTRFAVPARNAGVRRVFISGASQIAGLGASSTETTISCRIHEHLKALSGPLESIGRTGGYQTLGLGQLADEFERNWAAFGPQMLIFSNMDIVQDHTKEELAALTAFFRRCQEHKIRLVLLIPGEDPEISRVHDAGADLPRIARSLGVAVIDMRPFFAQNAVRDRGLLWWDGWHFTEYSQDLVADWLAPQLAALW